MRLKLLLLLLFSSLAFAAQAGQFKIVPYAEQFDELSDSAFFQQFPFAEYLQKNAPLRLKHLEADRKYLENRGRDPEEFLIQLIEKYKISNTLMVNDLSAYFETIRLAESFHAVKGVLPIIYPILADELFSNCSKTLQQQIADDQLSKHDEEVKYLIRRLEENQYMVNVEMSTWEKFTMNFWAGNWGYILDRFSTRHPYWFVLFVATCLAGLSLMVYLWNKWRRRRGGRQAAQQIQAQLDSIEDQALIRK
ncbi:MAG: hypothetical protein AAGG75_14945 [Bacteroidota bacterium]